MTKRPNIVLILADEMRGDTINNLNVKTPNLQSLKEDGGVIFSENYSISPICGPSRCGIFTGQYVHTSGHRSLFQLLQPNEENLLKILKNNGYEVVWVGRNDLFQKETGKQSIHKRITHMRTLVKRVIFKLPLKTKIKLLWEAFRIYVLKKYSMLESKIFEIMKPYFKNNPFSMDDPHRNSFYFGEKTKLQAEYDPDEMLTERTLKYLGSRHNKRRRKPLCLYIAFWSPHPPYTIEDPYFSMYDRKSIPNPITTNFDDKPKFMKLLHERYRLNELKNDDFKEIRATYYGMITKLDDLIGKIISKFKEIDMYDNTAFFFSSDHGDYAGDYKLTEKWATGMHDSLIHVPLIVKIPGLTPPVNIINGLTQTIDIFPTILEIAKIDTNYTHFGKSLIPIIKNEVSQHRDEVFAAGGYDTREPQCFEHILSSEEHPYIGIYFNKIEMQKTMPEIVCRTQIIRTLEWKLVMRSVKNQGEELYNLKDDPNELNNLINDLKYKEIIENLREKLIRFYIRTSDNPHWSHKREA
ncbi:MAG: sulfatase-like hydrolase/transferase [Asgard group archaeon]|nr:sulfatase-like hydrolase/transferase [Asgard group archaeon]